ncbi:MAG TPA: RNA polymerase sigma factor [Edaphobacter sp.]|nr:RNA polymerase sigma factor [Edaphobacter sp.]
MSSSVNTLMEQRSRFLAFVQRRVRDRQTAEDILQMAYLRAISTAESLREAPSADAWFFRILRNAVIDHYRHQAVETRTFTPWQPEIEHPAVTPDAAPANLCPCVNDAIKEVPASYQEIVRQVDLDEVPLDTFAKRAGINRGNAAVRVHRAHRSLRKKLIEQCGSCAGVGCLDCTCGHSPAH